MTQSVAPWLDAPLAEFVRQARVGLAVALEPSGRVLAQHGFTRSLDVMADPVFTELVQRIRKHFFSQGSLD